MVSQLLLLGLFGLACLGVVVRPFGISEGWFALGAAVIGLVTGLIGLGAAWASATTTIDVVLFFGGLLLLTGVLAKAGAMELAMDRMEGWSGDSPRRLLVATITATALVTILFSNDAAALLLAPTLISRLRQRLLPVAPYLLAVALISNAGSLVLPISNPINLLVVDRAHIPLAEYVAAVTPAALIGLMLAGLLLVVMSWRQLPARARPAAPTVTHDSTLLWMLAGLLAVLLLADLGLGACHLPLGPATMAAGLLAMAIWIIHTRGSPLRLLGSIRWSLLPLVIGFSVLAAGLEHSRLLQGLAQNVVGGAAVSPLVQFKVGAITAATAALANNLPATFLIGSGLAASHHLSAVAFSMITGADIGPNLAPAGSLSTILIFAAARQQGAAAPWWRFLRSGWVLGPVGLIATLALLSVLG
jgi:arsenical pump membrane protein